MLKLFTAIHVEVTNTGGKKATNKTKETKWKPMAHELQGSNRTDIPQIHFFLAHLARILHTFHICMTCYVAHEPQINNTLYINACWPDTFCRYIALTNQTTYEVARRKRIFYLRYVTIRAARFVISIVFLSSR